MSVCFDKQAYRAFRRSRDKPEPSVLRTPGFGGHSYSMLSHSVLTAQAGLSFGFAEIHLLSVALSNVCVL